MSIIMNAFRNETILIIDDNPDNLRLLSSILQDHGYRARAANNGKRALATIEKEQPGLILLDIMMPEMDGYEVCKKLKENKSTVNIPVIFTSALYETVDKVKAFSIGAVDYITKPFNSEEILARINTHLSLRALQVKLEENNRELQEAIEENKLLRGFLPICACCKKIRNDKGYWEQIESYISEHTSAKFSHGYCNECANKLFPELDLT